MAGKKATSTSTSTVAPADRVKQSFPKLKNASELLDQASNKLNKSAANFNTILKEIGLGIVSWFQFDGAQDNNAGYSWSPTPMEGSSGLRTATG